VFARLCSVIGQPELAQDERFSTHTARGTNAVELDRIIDDWTQTKTIAEVDQLMEASAVPAGGLYRAPEMLKDPHFIAREAIIDTPTEQWPDLKMQNVFPKMSKTQGEVRWTGPQTLGEHNENVYGSLLGLSSAELAELKNKSII
jgi:formyl-CoA transferase